MNSEQSVTDNDKLTKALVQVLGLARENENLLHQVIGKAKIDSQQSQILSMLLAAQGGMIDEEDESLDMPEHLAHREDTDFDDNYSVADRFAPEDVDHDEYEALCEVNDTVAAALGACQFCWGGDAECGECNGRGSPGFADPDHDLFKELVLPAVCRMRACRANQTMRPHYGAD